MGGRLAEGDMDRLEQWIGKGPKTITLLYAISRDGCNATTFHQKCDNKGPTLTVLYNQQGSVYGGYASTSWFSSSGEYVSSADSFLFQLSFYGANKSNTFSLKPNQRPKSIICNSTYGPIFGHGHDLHTFNDTINNAGGYFPLNGSLNIGTTYDNQNVTKDQINNGNMNVTELEVYRLAGIPQLVILTKIDKLCKEVEKDISVVFQSEAVGKHVEKAAQLLGLPRVNILPVKNYENEDDLDKNINIQALLSVRRILNFTEDYFQNLSFQKKDLQKGMEKLLMKK